MKDDACGKKKNPLFEKKGKEKKGKRKRETAPGARKIGREERKLQTGC
jgi:hypothetical protein